MQIHVFIITDLLSALLSAMFDSTLSTEIGIYCRYCWSLFLCPEQSANQHIIIAIPRAMQLAKDKTEKRYSKKMFTLEHSLRLKTGENE